MGCFLACFGFKTKKKSRRHGKKSPSLEQNHGSYVPLDSDVSTKLDIKENSITSDSHHLKGKPKEPSISKIKKKVSFNLNVKTYEPIPNNDETSMYLSEGEEETKWELSRETKSTASLYYEDDYSKTTSTRSSYRYQNCRDSFDDEDDELNFNENDLNFEETDDSDQELDDVSSDKSEDKMPKQEDFPWENHGFESKSRARDVFSVLNPVENITQWKIVKAKAAKQHLKCQKENLMSKQEGDNLLGTRPNYESLVHSEHKIAVDASLSDWNMSGVYI